MRLLILLLVVGCAMALPRSYYRRNVGSARLQAAPVVRPRRAPVHRTMLISGYYRPYYAQRRQGFEPESAMAAFATGDSVAAGSYLGTRGPNCVSCDPAVVGQDVPQYIVGPEGLAPGAELDQNQADVDKPLAYAPASPEVPLSDEVADDQEVAPVAPSRGKLPRRKTNKKVSPEEDEVGEEDSFSGGQKTYFPIVFRGYPLGRSGSGGNGGGGVTAIANSYSTGKGGVATSHATAYGGPAPASSRPKSPKRAEIPEPADDE